MEESEINRLNKNITFFILINLWLIIPLKYREWDLFQNTLQTSPKQHPPKTPLEESYLKAMISMD